MCKRSFLFIIVGIGIGLNLYSKKYTPYPILFCHGAGSKASAALPLFGVNEDTLAKKAFESGLGKFFKEINPKYHRYYFESVDDSFTDPNWNKMQCFDPNQDPKYDTLGPYLHAFSFKRVYNGKAYGSIDPDPDYEWTDENGIKHVGYEGEGAEVVKFCKLVLDKYYGDGDTTDISDWKGNQNAKLILIGHCAGGWAIREALT